MLVAIGIASTIDGTSGQGLLHEHRQQNPHTEDETVTPMSDFDEEAGRGAAPWLCCCAGKVSCPALPCPALPCPALPCPALPCPALPCPASCWVTISFVEIGITHSVPAVSCLASLPCPWATP